MPLKFRNIVNEVSHAMQPLDVPTYGSIYGQKQNTRVVLAVGALLATQIFLAYQNGLPGDSNSLYPTTLTVDSSACAFNGSTAVGSFVQPGQITIPRGNRGLTSVVTGLSVAAGQNLQICTYANAGTGFLVPAGTHARPNWAQQLQATTANLDGSLAASGITTPSERTTYNPLAAIGLSASPGLLHIGHSLTGGQGSDYERGYAQEAAIRLGVPCFQGGAAGSGPGSWFTSEKSFFSYGDVAVLHWWINAINEAVAASQTPSAFVAANSVTATKIIGEMKAMGIKYVIIATEGVTGHSGSAPHQAMLAAWNTAVRTNWAAWGANALLEIADTIMVSRDSDTIKPSLGGDSSNIHWGEQPHYEVSLVLESLLRSSVYLSQDDQKWSQTSPAYHEDFYGAATVPGANFGNWTQWQSSFAPFILYRGSGGYLGWNAPGAGVVNQYLIHSTINQQQGRIEICGIWPGENVNDAGWGCGWVLDTEGTGGRRYGYVAFPTRNGNFYIQRTSASGVANTTATITGGGMVAGDLFRLTLDHIDSTTGGGSDVIATLYRGSGTPVSTATLTNDTTAGLGRVNMKPAVVYQANLTEPPATSTAIDFVNIYDYTPYTITGITPNVTTASVAGGGTATFTATVAGTGSFPSAKTWRVVSGGGTIDLYSGVFVAPAATGSDQTIVVECASAGRDATATITITVPATGATITGIVINESSPASVAGGATATFTATVSGTGSFDASKTWSKVSGVGSINATTGVYTAPAATGSVQTALLRATASDGIHTADITVNIPAIGTSITSIVINQTSPFSLAGGATQTFTATVSGTGSFDASKTWSKVSGPGTINSSTGLYTAPAATGSFQTAVLRATASDGTHTADITVSIPAASVDNTALMATYFLTMIEEIGTSGQWRFKAAALSQVPSGGGSGNSGYEVRPGVLSVVLSDSFAAIPEIVLNVGETTWVESRVVDQDGAPISLDGSTLGVVLTGPSGFEQYLDASTQVEKVVDDAGLNIDGRFRWQATGASLGDLTGQARRNVRLTLSITRSASSVRTAFARIQVVG